jgi:hypothetical protein
LIHLLNVSVDLGENTEHSFSVVYTLFWLQPENFVSKIFPVLGPKILVSLGQLNKLVMWVGFRAIERTQQPRIVLMLRSKARNLGRRRVHENTVNHDPVLFAEVLPLSGTFKGLIFCILEPLSSHALQ